MTDFQKQIAEIGYPLELHIYRPIWRMADHDHLQAHILSYILRRLLQYQPGNQSPGDEYKCENGKVWLVVRHEEMMIKEFESSLSNSRLHRKIKKLLDKGLLEKQGIPKSHCYQYTLTKKFVRKIKEAQKAKWPAT